MRRARITQAVLAAVAAAAVVAVVAVVPGNAGDVPQARLAAQASDAPTITPPTVTPTPTPTPTPTLPPSTVPAGPDPSAGFRLIQANLRSPNTTAQVRQDVATIAAQGADFMTFNEVSRRADADIEPAGYAIWRTPGLYSGETPVLWRTDRWTEIAEGTTPILTIAQPPKHHPFALGMRYANWVTLVNNDGRVISVVSVHFTPPIKQWGNLNPTEIKNLGTLTNRLATSGPVMVGGDLNVAYGAKIYPRADLQNYGLVSSFDWFGTGMHTGDYSGASIDYNLVAQTDQSLVPVHQYATALNSDHKALTTDWSYLTAAPGPGGLAGLARFAPGKVVNQPRSGSMSKRRAALSPLVQAIRNAPTGSAVHLLTTSVSDRYVRQALLQAHSRGVNVQVIVRDRRLNGTEKALRSSLGTRTWTRTRTWFHRCSSRACLQLARHMSPTLLLVSQSGQTPAVRMILNRALDRTAARTAATSRVTTDLTSYNAAFRRYFALVGQKIG